MVELFHYHGGRPPVRVEVEKPTITEERRRMLERLTPEQREQYTDLLLAMKREPLQLAPPALMPVGASRTR